MRASTNKIILTAIGVIVAVALGLTLSRAMLIAWLCAFAFFTFTALGALMFDCMFALGGAGLRASWRPAATWASRWMVISPIVYLPLAVGMQRVGSWSSQTFAGQTWFLNVPFALTRAFVYFFVWIAAARFIVANRGGTSKTVIALLSVFITATFAAIDWIMALTPAWHSSDFGLRWTVNGLSTAAAIAIARQSRAQAGMSDAAIRLRIDGANVLFALNLGWIYLMFVDYITAWSGNLPDEAGWYVMRTHGVWLGAIIFIVACHVVALMTLLFRGVKRSSSILPWVAALIAIAQWLEAVWTIAPQANAANATVVALAALVTCVLAVAFAFVPRPIRAGEARAHG